MTQKALLIFEDLPDNEVNIKLTFDPPLKGDADTPPSVHYALKAMEALTKIAQEQNDEAT